MSWFILALKKYATFSGRARRKEYWFFVLFYVLISIVATVIDSMTGSFDPTMGMGMLGLLVALALLIPSLAVAVRRLHDTDRSGWWVLLCLIPLIGGIWLLVLLCLDSTPGDNRFGPNPKEETG